MENLIDQWLSAWSAFKRDELLSFYSESFYYVDPALKMPLFNKEDFSSYLLKLKLSYPNWNWQREELFGRDHLWCLKWRADFGDQQIVTGLDILEFERGKIKRNEVYFDRSLIKGPHKSGAAR